MTEGLPASPRVGLTTLGCKVNRADSEAVATRLLELGAVIEDDASAADAIIVNTCCVTQEAEKKVRKAVRRALRECQGPVYVTGCLARLDGSGLDSLGARVHIVGDPDEVVGEIATSAGPGRDAVRTSAAAPGSAGFRTRVAVKVEDGCDHGCAYCIVPTVRGNPRSVALEDVRVRAESLVASGTREIVLSGVNLGLWMDGERTLADLVSAVAATGVPRLRLSSIEPLHLDERLLDALATSSVICPHLHVPLQSGSDAVLDRMGRGYDAMAYVSHVRAAASALPGLAVTTDVMTGFPGESEADHAATVSLLEDLGDVMRRLHVFRYSVRPGTRAAMLQDPVDASVAESRARELREMGESMQRAHAAGAVGSEVEVLVEHVDGGVAVGTTRDYLRARIDRAGLAVGEIAVATAADVDDFDVVCA